MNGIGFNKAIHGGNGIGIAFCDWFPDGGFFQGERFFGGTLDDDLGILSIREQIIGALKNNNYIRYRASRALGITLRQLGG